MTKKHYELIASALHRTRMVQEMKGNAKERSAAVGAVRLATIDIAATLANDNPSFDKGRFLNAVGFGA